MGGFCLDPHCLASAAAAKIIEPHAEKEVAQEEAAERAPAPEKPVSALLKAHMDSSDDEDPRDDPANIRRRGMNMVSPGNSPAEGPEASRKGLEKSGETELRHGGGKEAARGDEPDEEVSKLPEVATASPERKGQDRARGDLNAHEQPKGGHSAGAEAKPGSQLPAPGKRLTLRERMAMRGINAKK